MKIQQRARKALGSSLTDINLSLRNDSRRRFEGGTNVMARPKLAPLRTSRGSKPPPRPGQFACPAAAPQNVQDVRGHAELTRPVR
jgi:hypothetical protein